MRGVRAGAEPGGYEMIFGRRAFFGHALAPDGEVWWFANVPQRDEPAAGELRAIGDDEWRRRLLELFAGDAGPADALIRATTELMPMSPIHAMPRLPVWHRGRMIVIGDAAHAPSPTSGQGASLSVEDAVVLAKSLRDAPGPRPRSPGSRPRAARASSASSSGRPGSTAARPPARWARPCATR